NYVVGDSRRISQILLNILGNAVKFTPKGVIALRLRSNHLANGKHAIYFEVEDNGIGIPAAMHKSIFDEFSQIDHVNTVNKGTGLGLPIVRKLLLKMGSDIHLVSAPGKGSTFSFTITFKEATLLEVIGKPKKGEADEEEVLTDLTNQRILIVDDNKINRMVTRRVLEKQHAQVFEAQNGEEALERVRKHHFDLILMDINMPGMNGYETTKEIRVFDKTIPIIALTAAEANYIKQKAKERGMNDVITKPYNLSQFSKVIAKELKKDSLLGAGL
ncbi:MAG: response regulator, partial [Bacteroidota bacterium]|nr:response regulator [Bacteroidota bacterium]